MINLDLLVLWLQKNLVGATELIELDHYRIFHAGRENAYLSTIRRVNEQFGRRYEDNLGLLKEYLREKTLERPLEKD